MNDIPRDGIGGNFPPTDLKSDIEFRYNDALNQVTDLLDVAATVPDELNDETQPKAAELIKKIRFLETTLDGARKLEKEPFDQSVKLVNGVFNTRIDRLEAVRKSLNERSQAFLEKKAAAERRRVQEEEERRRAKAAEDLRLAEEAEAKKRAAEAAQAAAEAAALAAQVARDKAIQDAKDAEARAEAAKVREAELKALAIKRMAEDVAQAKLKEERDAIEQAEREALRVVEAKEMAKAKAAREAEQKTAEEARAAAAASLADRRNHEEAVRLAKANIRTAQRDENASLDSAMREEKRADRLADVAAGPEVDLARTRSEYGAVSTLGRHWKYRIVDVNKLDMRALWPHVSTDEKAIALRKWAQLQPVEKRHMDGAIMEIETVGQVR